MAEGRESLKIPSVLPVTNYRRSEYDEVTQVGNSFFTYNCNVCNFRLNSKPQYEDHCKGKKHISKLNNNQLLDNNHKNLETMQRESQSLNDLTSGQESVNKCAGAGAGGGSDDGDNVRDEKEGDNHCSYCDIHFSSPIHRNDHYRGRKHENAKKCRNMKAVPLYCEVCRVTFTSEISANAHYISNKHKNRLALANDTTQINGHNKTTWYTCETCNVPLNSPQQLRIHKNSDKHKRIENLISNSRRSSLTNMENTPETNEENQQSILNKNCAAKQESSVSDKICKVLFTEENNSKPSENETTSTQEVESLPQNIIAATADDETEYKQAKVYNKELNISSSCGHFSPTSIPCVVSNLDKHENDLDTDSRKISGDSSNRDCNSTQTRLQIATGGDYCSNLNPPPTATTRKEKVPISQHINITTKTTGTSPSSNKLIQSNNLSVASSSPLVPAAPGLEKTSSVTNNNSTSGDFTTVMEEDYISPDEITKMIERLSIASTSENKITNNPVVETNSNNKNNNNNNRFSQELNSNSSRGTKSNNLRLGPKTKSTAASSAAPEEEQIIPDSQKPYIETIERDGKILSYYCNLCKCQLNAGSIKSHLEGTNHRHKVIITQVPERNLPPVENTCEDALDEAYNLTKKYIPRIYQVELFEKCYSTDSIIFLPTGTGKTLCAAMLISYMIKKNPKRSVLFLVDKVLLAFQQKRFIEEQLKDIKFSRFDFEKKEFVERELNIVCVCGGGTVGTQDQPLWMYDIVVSTAKSCSNLMDQKVLRWSDFSFVVLDEAHHCAKNHPFKRIFETQHTILDKEKRPQVLGLTASPAGQDTLKGTISMLLSLSMNMGDAKISIVQDNKDALKKYQSNAKLELEILSPNEEELTFNSELQKYLKQCLLQLRKKSNISNYVEFLNTEWGDWLSAEKLDELLNAFNEVTIDKDKAASTFLLLHTKKITNALSISLGCGIPLALEELKFLSDQSNYVDGFSGASELGLSYENIKQRCVKYSEIMEDELWEKNEIMSTIHFLINKISKHLEKSKDKQKPIILILVKQRETAVRLNKLMQKSTAMKQLNLSSVALIGHGAGSGVGMKVGNQKKTLEEIKDNQHQVIIATSVAEEGIDLPECSLVLTLKPPTSVVTLVQMRGRARKENSLFLTICNNEREKLKTENLLKQEKVMEQATHKLADFYKNQAIKMADKLIN